MTHAALIFSHSITPRLQYTVDFLSRYYGLSFRLTSSEEKYQQAPENCKINYGYHRLAAGEIFIHAHVLLTESYVRQVKVECFEHHGYKAFFKAEGDTGFDLFAGIFYLITRYEEYLPHAEDAFGRFDHRGSVAAREGFLHLPLVNIWLEDFRKLLSQRNPEFEKKVNRFRFVPTYDIDMAWSFRNKGFKRNAGALVLLFLKLKFRRFVHRIRVLRGRRPDPFDAYSWMDDLHARYYLEPIYFFLVAKEKGRHDKNIDTDNPEFRELIRTISDRYTVGLHPSWHSGDQPALVRKEKAILEAISDQPVDASRQHFIRFRLPATYQQLLSAGIRNDFSMGYGSINGFRASIATSFYWYDLKREEKTELLIHPFCFMDANAYFEEKLSLPEAAAQLQQFTESIRAVDGDLITIWHNSFLGTDDAFTGWRDVYENFVRGVIGSGVQEAGGNADETGERIHEKAETEDRPENSHQEQG